MKKSLIVLSLFMVSLVVIGVPGMSRAGDLKVSGFVDTIYVISAEVADGLNGNDNPVEGWFLAKGEVDFEKEDGSVTFRLDLDFPGSSSGGIGGTLANTNFIAGGLPLGATTFADTVEQARFDWAVPFGEPVKLTLTAGIYNAPFGYEAQDAPDRTFITFGQLSTMVPFNLAGVRVAASHGPISASLVYADEFRSAEGDDGEFDPVDGGTVEGILGEGTFPASEENSFGATLDFKPMPEANLYIGYLTSEQNIVKQDEDILDVIFWGTAMPVANMDFNYGLEYLKDENNDAWSLSVEAVHEENHGVALRYDMVDCDKDTAYGFCDDLLGSLGSLGAIPTTTSHDNTPSTLTVGVWADLASTVRAKLEWSNFDPDVSGLDSVDAFFLQLVAKFM